MWKSQTVVLILFLGICGKAFSAADFDACAKEMQQVMRTEVNCQIRVRPVELARLREITQGVIKDMTCLVPFRFEKSSIYSRWIQPGQLSMPRLNLRCSLAAEGDQALEMTSVIKPECDKKGEKWHCDINMSETMGIGILGSILEAYFNTDSEIKRRMGEALETLE